MRDFRLNTRLLFLFGIAILVNSCSRKVPVIHATLQTDHSFANLGKVSVKHMHLDLECDFSSQKLKGSVTHHLADIQTDTLILDTRNLHISRVVLNGSKAVNYMFGQTDTLFGTALLIPIDSLTRTVQIWYETGKESEALQWLNPSQTHDKNHPFLYTQSQAILARTWIPLMDRPDLRFTYSARIQCPKNLLALMSATNPQGMNDSGIYHFTMEQPIPSYLLALAAGHVQFRALGDSCGIYAEPGFLEAVAWELADMPAMIQKASALYGQYLWGRYDVLMMPPAFPFGGMENPRLTFATPTIIAGDRSLTGLIAHELAHSWSGNLVTNSSWNDLWLNEGFTVYFENRITEAIYGKDIAEMNAALEVGELKLTLQELMQKNPEDTRLAINLKGRNPDAGLSDIAYIKGFLFLKHLENLVGRERWDAFLRTYFASHAFQTINTEAFREYLEASDLITTAEMSVKAQIRAWLYDTGMPDGWPEPQSLRMKIARAAAENFMRSGVIDSSVAGNWVTQQYQEFMRSLPNTIGKSQLEILDQTFGFTNSGNAEILADWFTLAARHGYTPAYAAMEKFLIQVGRRKFLKPVYGTLAETPDGLKLARKIFARARQGYHAVSANTIAKMLHVR
jgi:leukotriene-A4 hydrolase